MFLKNIQKYPKKSIFVKQRENLENLTFGNREGELIYLSLKLKQKLKIKLKVVKTSYTV